MNFENENNELRNKKNEGFSMPEGYFSSSAQSLMNKIQWQEEHKSFPVLSTLKKESGFLIPDDYFVRSEQQLELVPYAILSQPQTKSSGFVLPESYFEKELTLTPYLSSLEKRLPFIVPENYFEKSAEKLFPAPKVISLFSKRIMYSIAALLVVCLGIWLVQSYSNSKLEQDCGNLACVDKQELLKSNAIQSLDEEHLYDMVNVKALEEKLNTKSNPSTDKNTNDSVANELLEENIDEL